jgi:hypothetical protein
MVAAELLTCIAVWLWCCQHRQQAPGQQALAGVVAVKAVHKQGKQRSSRTRQTMRVAQDYGQQNIIACHYIHVVAAVRLFSTVCTACGFLLDTNVTIDMHVLAAAVERSCSHT